MKKFILIGLVVALGAAIAGYFYVQQPVASIADDPAYGTYSSEALYTYFEEDEAKATEELTGKVLEVSGEIAEVLVNSDSSTTVVLRSAHPIFGVKCRYEPSATDLNVEVGEMISIKGVCTGMTADVEMNQCVNLNRKS